MGWWCHTDGSLHPGKLLCTQRAVSRQPKLDSSMSRLDMADMQTENQCHDSYALPLFWEVSMSVSIYVCTLYARSVKPYIKQFSLKQRFFKYLSQSVPAAKWSSISLRASLLFELMHFTHCSRYFLEIRQNLSFLHKPYHAASIQRSTTACGHHPRQDCGLSCSC